MFSTKKNYTLVFVGTIIMYIPRFLVHFSHRKLVVSVILELICVAVQVERFEIHDSWKILGIHHIRVNQT